MENNNEILKKLEKKKDLLNTVLIDCKSDILNKKYNIIKQEKLMYDKIIELEKTINFNRGDGYGNDWGISEEHKEINNCNIFIKSYHKNLAISIAEYDMIMIEYKEIMRLIIKLEYN